MDITSHKSQTAEVQNIRIIKKFHKSLRHNRKIWKPCGNFLTFEQKKLWNDDIIPTSERKKRRKISFAKGHLRALESFFLCRSLTGPDKLNQMRNERRCRAPKLCMRRNSILININFHKWMSTARSSLVTKNKKGKNPILNVYARKLF